MKLNAKPSNYARPDKHKAESMLKGNREKSIDKVDFDLIKTLTRDSRVSLRELSRTTGLTVNTVQARLGKLENKGIVKGYTPIIDSAKMGYAVAAVIMVQAEGDHLDEVTDEISRESNVLSIYEITGDFDAVVFAHFKDNSELNGFLKRLLATRYVKRTVTMTASRIVKEGTCLF